MLGFPDVQPWFRRDADTPRTGGRPLQLHAHWRGILEADQKRHERNTDWPGHRTDGEYSNMCSDERLREGSLGGYWLAPYEDIGSDHNPMWNRRTGPLNWWFTWSTFSIPSAGTTLHVAAIPLWFLWLVAAVPTALAWRRRARVDPGVCPACNYSLAGIPPGSPCPECGGPNVATE